LLDAAVCSFSLACAGLIPKSEPLTGVLEAWAGAGGVEKGLPPVFESNRFEEGRPLAAGLLASPDCPADVENKFRGGGVDDAPRDA